MDKYNVLATGSTGNAILYHDSILVDCGVSYKLIEPHINTIQLVLLTHSHSDHLFISTLAKMQSIRPGIRIACEINLYAFLDSQLKNVDLVEIGEWYNYGSFKISPIKLFHDVPNVGYRIFKDNYKIIHATDTAHLQGVEAKDYDLYAIEHNYNSETIEKRISEKESNGEFAYEKGSINSHLSEQQAREFIFNNRKDSSEVLRLHESKNG